jgi:hypothetical protein
MRLVIRSTAGAAGATDHAGDAGDAPSVSPVHPASYLGSLSPWPGHITRVAPRGPALEPAGLIFAGLG